MQSIHLIYSLIGITKLKICRYNSGKYFIYFQDERINLINKIPKCIFFLTLNDKHFIFIAESRI